MKHIICSLVLISSAIHGSASSGNTKKKTVSLHLKVVPQQLLNQLLLYHSKQTDKDSLDFVVSLLQVNADVNTNDKNGHTPVIYAAHNLANGNNFFSRMWTSQMMRLLVRAGATGVDTTALTKMIAAIKEQKENENFSHIPAHYDEIPLSIVTKSQGSRWTDWLPVSVDCCSQNKPTDKTDSKKNEHTEFKDEEEFVV